MPPRIRRSRALWDEARRPEASWTASVRAVLYELQPIRFSAIRSNLPNVRQVSRIPYVVASSGRFAGVVIGHTARALVRFASNLGWREWGYVGCIIAYYYAVRYIHRTLEAGPLVVIITAMVAIFTIGLSDEQSADGLSAYSVFNRGFQRLLGSVDVDSLVQQYAGGAMAMHAPVQQNIDPGHVRNGDDENDDFGRRRGGNDAAAAAAARPNVDNGNNGDDDDDDDDDNDAPAQNDGQNNRPRRSNKKSRRRRNVEVRREMERQRQAAAAMGFGGEGGDQDVAAMNRLIEDQIAGAGAGDVGERGGVVAGDAIDTGWEEVDGEEHD